MYPELLAFFAFAEATLVSCEMTQISVAVLGVSKIGREIF